MPELQQEVESLNLELKAEIERWATAICPDRTGLDKPIWDDGHLYITNGAIAIRFVAPVNWVDCFESGNEASKTLKEAFAKEAKIERKPIEFDIQGLESWWRKESQCESCGGHGGQDCVHCGQYAGCEDCEGTGMSYTHGERAEEKFRFEGFLYKRRLLWLVSQLPGLTIGFSSKSKEWDRKQTAALCFNHAYGEGILMPVWERP